MISYSTNWMGPVSTQWYEENCIPYTMKMSSGECISPPFEYKDYTESYSCGRIDVYGLDEEEHWSGRHEYSLGVMRTEDWQELTKWLNTCKTEELLSYEELIDGFEKTYSKSIKWFNNED